MMRKIGSLAALTLALAGCATQPGLTPEQLFCSFATTTGPLVVAVLDIAGVPYIVTDKAAATVAAACAAIPAPGNPAKSAGAIPVAPPPNPATAPAVAVKVKQ